ncbi:MAG: sugar phosphate isomerase/epimerase [Ruminococcaceae bacterium]|nr:sugar phosphate isomerase/epimerase [Oscillospiraceae bacterium]
MIKLGVNTVLFKDFTFGEACTAIAAAGYDGVEISAIKGMCEHLDPENWREQKAYIKACLNFTGMKILSSEVASQDPDRLRKAFEAAVELEIPVINVGPGGKSDDEEDLKHSIESLQNLAEMAKGYGITLCTKAHVGAAIYNTPTTLAAMQGITSEAFGIDMDPSHIYRAGENPAEALPAVISRVKHVHIRDCKGRQQNPGLPPMQACGRGDIDLAGYFKALVDANYDGPVSLEVIGPSQTLAQACTIAAESYGYMNAILKSLNAR